MLAPPLKFETLSLGFTNSKNGLIEKTRISNKGQVVIPRALRLLQGSKIGVEFVTVCNGEKK